MTIRRVAHEFIGLSEVARVASRSLSTVNRNLSKLRDYGAYKDDEGVWRVPITAIEGVGWHVTGDMPRDSASAAPVVSRETSPDMSEIRTQLGSLQEELTVLRGRLTVAEADAEKWQMIAAERLQNLDDLRRSQRLLESHSAVERPGGDEPRGSHAGVERRDATGGFWERLKRR